MGVTHKTAAHRLHISVRSVGTHLAHIRQALAARTAYAMGAYAVRFKHVDPDAVVTRASARTSGRWISPTTRQSTILRLLASGATDQEIAAKIGISETTVRRDVSRLAVANGAPARITAGALFEALGWN